MSNDSEADKVLSSARELKFLGPDRAFLTLIFALWTARKRSGLGGVLTKFGFFTAGVGGYGYWNGFF